MNNIPVIVFKNKKKENRYLALSMEVGDWSDPELDVTLENADRAYMIWRKDFSKPDEKDVQNVLEESNQHKQRIKGEFGDTSLVSYDVEEWLKHYDPVNIEVTKEQFDQAQEYSGL